MDDKEKNQETAGETHGQSQYIDDNIYPVSENISKGSFEKIRKHDVEFG
jgi:hypothetical protein